MKIDVEISKRNIEERLKQKAEGKVLLDIRTRINELENQISQNRKNLEGIKKNYLTTETILEKILVKLSSVILELNKTSNDLKEKLNDFLSNDLRASNNLKFFYEKIKELETETSNKDKLIENLKEQIEQKDIQIEIDKNDLDRTILHKDQAIFKLISDLEVKMNFIKEQKEIINELQDKSDNIEAISSILKKIKSLIKIKGFITEFELDETIDSIYKATTPLY